MAPLLPTSDELSLEIDRFEIDNLDPEILEGNETTKGYSTMSPEQAMWAAVIEQAARDLFYMPNAQFITGQIITIRNSSYAFFFSKSSHYIQYRDFVLTTIDLDLDVILSALQKRIKKFKQNQQKSSKCKAHVLNVN